MHRLRMTDWSRSAKHPSLRTGDIHIWRLQFSELTHHLGAAYEVLSEDERKRAARFRFEKDRVQSILSRGVLRGLLAEYFRISPVVIEFYYGPSNKPEIAQPVRTDSNALSFNVSHSGDIALIAVSLFPNIGVDVEFMRPNFATREVAERFFSPLEVSRLMSLPERLHADAFFNCWTRKEAYIKAVGGGLSIPLDSFDVEFRPGKAPRLLDARGDAVPASRWWLGAIEPGEGYKGAIMVKGRPASVELYDYSPTAAE